jgi:hypothetical protein
VLLPRLLLGAVAAVEATGGGAERAVMAGIVAGDPADYGAFQAAFGVGGRCCRERENGDGENGEYGSHDAALQKEGRTVNGGRVARFRIAYRIPRMRGV